MLLLCDAVIYIDIDIYQVGCFFTTTKMTRIPDVNRTAVGRQELDMSNMAVAMFFVKKLGYGRRARYKQSS